jgi:phosphopantothenoylcysteine decarboxylase/phosphopantothenate--cysteine ligase|tara:strand:+ start:2747 stop:3946 length:1200 start_codon:yes stop_codon:yes gene_type:complete
MLNNKNVLLGVSASIAAYKAANIVRLLKKSGANVQVVQTPKSLDFVTSLTLSTLSENPVISEMINDENKTWNSHVELALWADIMIIAPATAKTISKMVNGACDNILLATYLSSKCPVYFAPAMDVDMYKHNSTISNIKKLESYSNILLPPTFGELASGLVGEGRMQNPEDIISFINNDLSKKSPLLGVNILITAGPTYEHIDRVRYITNYSSGKMGVSLAKVGADLGAEITLVLGPSHQEIRHSKIKIINVISAEEMYVAVKENFDSMNIGIFSAAVSDYRPVKQSLNKLKKIKDNLNIELEPTKDILSEISLNKDKSQYIVGFALETNNEIDNAKIKLKNKQLDLIVLNSLNDKGAGFMYNTNKISIIDSNNNIEHFKMKLKEDVAKDIFDKILTQRK